MKFFYSALVSSALFCSTYAVEDTDRTLIEARMHEDPTPATFNSPVDFDNFDTLSATDTVNVLMQRKPGVSPTSIVYPASFNVLTEIQSDGIVAGSMTKQDFDSMANDPNSGVIIEYDSTVHALEEDHVGNLRRNLAEETPYGITMVLEDADFWKSLGEPSGTIKVCVADTGYDRGHVDLPDGNDVTGTSTDSYSENWYEDGHGHGTHCSGTVAAIGSNNEGVVGVIPNNAGGKFQLVIGNALTRSGSGSWSGVMKAVENCIKDGAKVVSMSLGGTSATIPNNFFSDKYEQQGILFIGAAGNSGTSAKSYPASYPSVMSVAAISSSKARAYFSQYNNQVEISAPGVSVKSSLPDDQYASWSGTSMATPHVAGVAGLLWMHFPTCKNYEIRNVMLQTAQDLGSSGCDDFYGFGLVQAKAAYQLLAKGNCGGNIGKDKGDTGGCAQLTPTTPSPSTSPPNPTPTTPNPAPTMYPTHKAPTPYPTEVPPTPYPTGKTCAVLKEPCKRHNDCCKKKCNRNKGFCRQ